MQAMKSEKPNGLYRPAPVEDESSYQEMIEPIFAKNRYGREDLLAMMGKEPKVPPEGLERCAFFVEKAQAPIILMPLTEAEHRTMQQFNSSKALSSLSRQDRHSMLNGEGGGSGSTSSSAWIPAGIGVKSGSFITAKAPPPVQSRWSALGPSNSRATGLSSTKRTNVDTITTITKPISAEQRPPNSSLSLRNRLRSTSDDNPPQTQQPPPVRLDAIPITSQTSTQLSHHAWQGADTKDSFESWKTFEADIANSLMLDADDIIPPDRTPRVTSTAVCPPASMAGKSPGERDDENISQATSRRLTSTHSPQTAEDGGKTSQWVYIDPTGNPQGPFDGQKMHNWFVNGYFDKGLRLRKVGEDAFTTLGAIIQANESDPFGSVGSSSPSPAVQPPLRQQQPPFSIPGLRSIVYSNKEIEALESNPWTTQPPTTVPIPGLSLLEREAELKKEQLLKEKERHIEEERRKLQEKEELLRREMQERDEKERRMREMEAQLKLKEAEIEQIARARNQELENKRLEVAEFERQKREALIQMEEQIRNERLQRQKEEEEVRRAQEEQRRLAIEAETRRRHQEEEVRRKQEEQRRLALEVEEKRKLEEERKIRAAYEEARRMQEKALQDGRKASPIVRQMASVPVSAPPVQQYSMSAAPRSWNVIQAPQPVPIPAPKQSAKQSPRQESASSKKKGKGNTAAPTAASSQDPFVKWVIKRVVELNTAVDAEVFAGFIEGIDSPNEVEDYIVSYFGDTKVAHDFLKEFLNKRIELRPRVHNIAKDDLSSALSASGPMQTTAISTGANPAALIAGAGASANKKSKGKQKTLDPNILGFRVVTDPRRVNVGEIDSEPPAPTRRKKR